MGSPPEPLRVLIIGAGSAGLLMGHVFKKVGIDATIFEQDESPTTRPRDWNFGIYWAQSRIEECLTPELSALIDTVQTDPSYRRHEASTFPIYNGVTAEPLKEHSAPYAIRLRRRAWLGLIRTGLDVRQSKKLRSIVTYEEGVTATFEDGAVEKGTLLIGAEGAHSVTRDWLFASSPGHGALQHTPISCFTTLVKLHRETALSLREIHPTYCLTVDFNGLVTFFATHDCTAQDPADWTFMFIMTWNFDETEDHAALARDGDLLLDKVRAMAEPLAHPFKAMVQDISRGTKTWYSSRLSYWPTTPWDSRGGRVTLAGDAAHAMTFHRGQGLGNVITDAAELQTHLRAMKAHTRDELAAAVDKYEKEVWPRGRQVVMENKENTEALHNWEKVSQSPIMVCGTRRYHDSSRNGDEDGSSG